MKIQANSLPNEVESLQGGILLRFNIEQITVPNLDGTSEIQFQYDEVKIETSDLRNDIINKIILTQYLPNDETAMINNHIANIDVNNNYAAYQTFRASAKLLADKVIAQRGF